MPLTGADENPWIGRDENPLTGADEKPLTGFGVKPETAFGVNPLTAPARGVVGVGPVVCAKTEAATKTQQLVRMKYFFINPP